MAMKSAEETVISAVSQATDFVAGVLPDLPSNPVADSIPTPRETTKTAFNLAEKFLANAKDYSIELVKALETLFMFVANTRFTSLGAVGLAPPDP